MREQVYSSVHEKLFVEGVHHQREKDTEVTSSLLFAFFICMCILTYSTSRVPTSPSDNEPSCPPNTPSVRACALARARRRRRRRRRSMATMITAASGRRRPPSSTRPPCSRAWRTKTRRIRCGGRSWRTKWRAGCRSSRRSGRRAVNCRRSATVARRSTSV